MWYVFVVVVSRRITHTPTLPNVKPLSKEKGTKKT